MKQERCPTCIGGWLCKSCQQEGLIRDRQRMAAVRDVCQSYRRMAIDRLCSRFELESDEFSTAEEKAIALLGE